MLNKYYFNWLEKKHKLGVHIHTVPPFTQLTTHTDRSGQAAARERRAQLVPAARPVPTCAPAAPAAAAAAPRGRS